MPRPSAMILTVLMLSALTACADKPEDFARRMQAALDSGDVDAALALGALEKAPPDALYFYIDNVGDCAIQQTCTVSLTDYDEKAAEKAAAMAAEGIAYGAQPEGLLKIDIKPYPDTVGGGTGTATMPYGRVNGKLRVLGGNYTTEKLAELRATSNESRVDDLLEVGIYDSALGQHRTDWKTAATKLPADGGEHGRWLVDKTARLAAAYATGDPDAAIKAGGSAEARIFGSTDYAGKPVSLEARKIKLRAEAARAMKSVRVQGGYQLGDDAVLQFEAETISGWVKRGAVLVGRTDGEFGIGGWRVVSHPK